MKYTYLTIGPDDPGSAVTISGTVPVSAVSLPLPTGASTAALQLPDGHNVTVDNASIPITAASLPLPAGAATAANQYLSKTKFKKTIDFTASQTAQTIWDPTGGTTYHITGWVISFSAAGAFHMFDDTDTTANRIAKYFGAINGGANLSSLDIPGGAADNILKYTTGAGCVGSITVYGFEE